ncbi:MAG: STAS domain-containing protein [Chitinophagaceae bacterium]
MQVKIDTKEKFHVITINENELPAIMTEKFENSLLTYLKYATKNVVLNLKDINIISDAAAKALIYVQQTYYDQEASFVICGLRPEVEEILEKKGFLELMNVVPTESEAGDIVQMEEVERELLRDE